MMRKTKITSREAAKSFGACQDTALRGPIIITKNGKPHTVLLAYEDYRRIVREETPEPEAAKSSLAAISADFTRELRAKGRPAKGKRADKAFIDGLYEERSGDGDFSRTDIELA